MKPHCMNCGKTHQRQDSAEHAARYGCGECGSTDVDFGMAQTDMPPRRRVWRPRSEIVTTSQFHDWCGNLKRLKGGDST